MKTKVIQNIKSKRRTICEATSLTSQHKSLSVSGLKSYISRQRIIRISGLLSSILLLFVASFTLSPIVKEANPVEAAPGTASASSTTLDITTLGHPSANLDITPTSTSGTFSSSTCSGSSNDTCAKFSVTTNNYSGYNLSIKTNNSAGTLVNSAASGGSGSGSGSGSSDSNSATLSSISSAMSESTFSNSSNTAYNGKWGYKPSKLNSTINTNYLPSPTSTTTLDNTTSANSNGTSNTYTIALGARVDYSKPAGTYTDTFVLTAVGNPITYTIN